MPLCAVLDLPIWAVERSQAEVIEVVVKSVHRAVPAVDRVLACSLHELLDLLLPGGRARHQHFGDGRIRVHVPRLGRGGAEARRVLEKPGVCPGWRERDQRRSEPFPPLQVLPHARIRLGSAGRGRSWAAVANAQGRDRELVLQGVHRRKVGLPVDLNATDDHEDPRRRRNEPRAGRRRSGPAVGCQKKLAFVRPRRAAPDVGEIIRPGVDELKHLVAAAGVGHAQYERSPAHITRGQDVQRVVVGRDELSLRPKQLARIAELVVRSAERERRDVVRKPIDLVQVLHERVAVDVDLRRELHTLDTISGVSHAYPPSSFSRFRGASHGGSLGTILAGRAREAPALHSAHRS